MMKKITLPSFYLSLIFTFFITINLQSQTGCPGCQVDVPNNMAEDTLYLAPVPDGQANTPYSEDVSFRMPKTTTPVSVTDSTVMPGITLNDIKVSYITNVPPGIQWETNEDIYYPDTETDGCVKFCGTPLAAGTYVMDVVLEVGVLFINQTTSFQIVMEVLPTVSANDGFTMVNGSGCGEVTVDFQNNIPSNGNSGFSYFWDFGNGNTSNDENPNAQTYSNPGTYAVDYQAVVDTSGYVLTKVRVIDADCSDIISPPDLYLDILDPLGNSIMVTPSFDDVSPPVEFNLNIPLGLGNYTIVVKDEDGGINGSDDECDFYSFNQLSDGLLINGSSSVDLTILHPVDTITTTDSVYVYPQPEQPIVSYEVPLTWCENETIILSSSYSTGNQWFMNGDAINGGINQIWQVQESGTYMVSHTNGFGCSATSDPVEITIDPLPEIPIYNNTDNLLEVVVPGILPMDYSLQWYYENTLLPGENGLTYCLTQTGNVTLVVTDNATGCTNSFTNDHIFNPEYVCGVLGIEEVVNSSLKIYPNPFSEHLNIEFSMEETSDFEINIIDLLGRKIQIDQSNSIAGNFSKSYSLDGFSEGVYILEIDFGTYQIHKRVILQK